MGFLSKAWKGIKTAVKGTFKRVKKAFKSIGKFMNKIGIVGQLAMSMFLPGAGELFGALTKSLLDVSGKGIIGSIARGAGNFLNTAMKAANGVGKVFKDITSGVTNAIGNVVGTTINALPEPLAKGIRGGIENITGERITAKQIEGASFKKAFEHAGNIFTNTGKNVVNLFKDVTTPSKLNKYSAAIRDKQVADIQLKTDDIVKNVNDQLDGKIQPGTPPQISKEVTLTTDVPKTTGWTGGVTDAYKQQTAGAFGVEPLPATGQTISTPVAEDLLSEEANKWRLSTQKPPVPGVGSGPLGGPSAPHFKTDFETMRTGYDNVTTTPNIDTLEEVAPTAIRRSTEEFATAKKPSILDRKVWGTDVTPKEALGEAIVTTADQVVQGIGMKAAGLGPKTPQATYHTFNFNPDFARATSIGLEEQAEQGTVAMNQYITDYTKDNFSFMNEYPYGYNAYVNHMNEEQKRKSRGVFV